MDEETTQTANTRLLTFFQRIERLQAEKDALTEDMREVYAEAKGEGFNTKIMRAIVRLRKLSSHERAEQDELIDTYRKAIGL